MASASDTLEERLEQALGELEPMAPTRPSTSEIEDHLALFTRWCFRPVAKRVGDIVFADTGGVIPHKPLIRAISRVARSAAAAVPSATA
jgi:excinuclease ABC subunit C